MSGQSPRHRRVLRFVLATWTGLSALGVGHAQAEPGSGPGVGPEVALAWSGPGPELVCLGEDGLVQAVNEYLGRPAFASRSVEFLLHVNVERRPDRKWRAVLELRDASGRVLGARELASSTELCASLNEPLVLAVALMVDSDPEPEPVTGFVEPPAPLEPEPMEPVSTPPRRGRAARAPFAASASVALEAGLLPAVRPGLALGFELRAASWLSARLSGVAFLPSSVALEGNASIRIGLAAAGLALCPGFEAAETIHLALCAGAFYGALLVKSSGLDRGRSVERRLLAGAAGPRVIAALSSRWAVTAEVTGVVPYRPDRFTYDLNGARTEFFRVSDVSLWASVGPRVMF